MKLFNEDSAKVHNEISGNGNVVVSGNDNSINFPSTPSTLYKICKMLYQKMNIQEIRKIEYDITHNSEWIGKLEYNKISDYYNKRFLEVSLDIDTIEIVINSLENQDNFIKWLHKRYRMLCIKFPQKNKEEILVELNEELENMLKDAQKNDNIDIEELSLNIDKILFYGFTKCKILEPVPKRARS